MKINHLLLLTSMVSLIQANATEMNLDQTDQYLIAASRRYYIQGEINGHPSTVCHEQNSLDQRQLNNLLYPLRNIYATGKAKYTIEGKKEEQYFTCRVSDLAKQGYTLFEKNRKRFISLPIQVTKSEQLIATYYIHILYDQVKAALAKGEPTILSCQHSHKQYGDLQKKSITTTTLYPALETCRGRLNNYLQELSSPGLTHKRLILAAQQYYTITDGNRPSIRYNAWKLKPHKIEKLLAPFNQIEVRFSLNGLTAPAWFNPTVSNRDEFERRSPQIGFIPKAINEDNHLILHSYIETRYYDGEIEKDDKIRLLKIKGIKNITLDNGGMGNDIGVHFLDLAREGYHIGYLENEVALSFPVTLSWTILTHLEESAVSYQYSDHQYWVHIPFEMLDLNSNKKMSINNCYNFKSLFNEPCISRSFYPLAADYKQMLKETLKEINNNS